MHSNNYLSASEGDTNVECWLTIVISHFYAQFCPRVTSLMSICRGKKGIESMNLKVTYYKTKKNAEINFTGTTQGFIMYKEEKQMNKFLQKHLSHEGMMIMPSN